MIHLRWSNVFALHCTIGLSLTLVVLYWADVRYHCNMLVLYLLCVIVVWPMLVQRQTLVVIVVVVVVHSSCGEKWLLWEYTWTIYMDM